MQRVKKYTCAVCSKCFCFSDVLPYDLVRPQISDMIKEENPDWGAKCYICQYDLSRYRSNYLKRAMLEEHGQLSNLDKEVLDSLKEHDILTEDVSKLFRKEESFGDRLSDAVARVGGSWKFIFAFLIFLVGWMLFNTYCLMTRAFDPYPYILLNLVLSCLAAIQAPIIMMSQNRHAAHDRIRDNDEYRINLKTELEIRHLHSKIDLFTKKQWERMLEIQNIQIELAEQILNHNNHHHRKR